MPPLARCQFYLHAGMTLDLKLGVGHPVAEGKSRFEEAKAGDEFGDALAISGDLAVVGVNGDDNANGTDAGAAYIFERADREWTQVAKLTAADGAAADRFGFSVDIDGDTLITPFATIPVNSGGGATGAFVGHGGGMMHMLTRTQGGAARYTTHIFDGIQMVNYTGACE